MKLAVAGDTARTVAARVLYRVAERGAYAALALDAELSRTALDARDRALATELTYGTLRVVSELDVAIAQHLRVDVARLDALTHAIMRVAAYQLLHLDRIAPFAAVDEAVGHVRRERGPRLAGVANAVLRKVAASGPARPSVPPAVAVPEWLLSSLERSIGADRTARFLGPRELPPPIGLRVTSNIAEAEHRRQALAQRIRVAVARAQVRTGAASPLALLLRRAGDPRALPGWTAGDFVVQEEGAQVVAITVGALPGETLADVCAGRGGKTTWLAKCVGDQGHVTAIDVDDAKLGRIGEELSRLGVPRGRVDVAAVDVAVGTGGLGVFDRVMVDAPCTGLGTIHRRPELLLRTGPDDLGRLADVQLAILHNAVRLVRPGGTLVYSVCSLSYEEGPGVAAALEHECPGLVRLRELDTTALAGLAPDRDGILRIGPFGPDADSCPDGYQVVRWRVAAG